MDDERSGTSEPTGADVGGQAPPPVPANRSSQLDVAGCLADTLRVFLPIALPLTAASVALGLPSLWLLWTFRHDEVVFTLVSPALSAIEEGLLIAWFAHAAVARLERRPLTLAASARAGLPRIASTIGAGLLLSALLLAGLEAALGDDPSIEGTLLGCAALVPVLYLAARWWFADVAAALEPRNPASAFRRSWAVTSASLGRCLALIGVGATFLMLTIAPVILLGAMLKLSDAELDLLAEGAGRLINPIMTVFSCVVFARLRELHDGADHDRIASVFD